MVKDGALNHSDNDEEEENFSDDGDWGDWEEAADKDDDEGGFESDFICLFCDSRFVSCDSLFEHCRLSHGFDFRGARKELKLDFYASFKLINYIRSQVGESLCFLSSVSWALFLVLCFLCSVSCALFLDKVGSF